MTIPVRRQPMQQSQQEGTNEPETNPNVPHQEEQPDATEGEVIADYNPDVDQEGSEPENEQVPKEQKEEDPDATYMQTWTYLEVGLSAT